MKQASLLNFLKKKAPSNDPPVAPPTDPDVILVPETPERAQRSVHRERLSCSKKKTKPSAPQKSPFDGFNYSPFDQQPVKNHSDPVIDATPIIIDLCDSEKAPAAAVPEFVAESAAARRQRLLVEARRSAERREQARARKRSSIAVETEAAAAAAATADSVELSALLQELSDTAQREPKVRRKSDIAAPPLPNAGGELNGLLEELMEEHQGGEREDIQKLDEEREKNRWLQKETEENERKRNLEKKKEKLTERKGSTEENEEKRKRNIIKEKEKDRKGNTEKVEKKKGNEERKAKEKVVSKTGEIQPLTENVDKEKERKSGREQREGKKKEQDKELTGLLNELLRQNKEEEKEKAVAVKGKENEGPGPTQANCSASVERGTEALSESLCEMFEESFEEPSTRSDFYRGRLLSILKEDDVVHLEVTVSPSEIHRSVELSGFWTDSELSPGDVLHIIHPLHSDSGVLVVSDQHGFLVPSPDQLVSGTTVVSGLRCLRQAVLQTRHGQAGGTGSNRAMLLGSLVHAVFQEMIDLPLKEVTVQRCTEIATRCLRAKRLVETLIELKLRPSDILGDFEEYLGPLCGWIRRHRDPKAAIRVEKILDIEESIWSPWYGIKGNIDLTVLVSQNAGRPALMPLELKSGRASFSTEHSGQLILYTLLLEHSLRRRLAGEDHVTAGWLVYIKTGQSRLVASESSARRALIQRRNQLVAALRRTLREEEGEGGPQLAPLPRGISDRRWCEFCGQKVNCALYARTTREVLPEDHPLVELHNETLQHLSEADVAFFANWARLLLLEAKADSPPEAVMAAIHADTGSVKDCIRRAVLEDCSHNEDGGFLLTFKIPKEFQTVFTTGDFVVMSSDNGEFIALCLGSVKSLSDVRLELHCDKSLSSDGVPSFRLDRYSSQKILQTSLANLTALMTPDPLPSRLRDLLISDRSPQFDVTLSKQLVKKIRPVTKNLNIGQRSAVLRVLMAKDFVIVRGYPGSGKSSFLSALLQICVLVQIRVLLVSHTHSAVDNVLRKLLPFSRDFARLGSASRVHPELRSFLLDPSAFETEEEFARAVRCKPLLASTCLAAASSPLLTSSFDLVLMDEAGQVTLPSALGALHLLSPTGRFVLVGDSAQLPPVVRSHQAARLGLGDSLLTILEAREADREGRGAVVTLSEQYRMNSSVLRLSNALAYDNRMRCASEEVACADLRRLCPSLRQPAVCNVLWMEKVASPDLSDSVVFLDTQKKNWSAQKDDRGSLCNPEEAEFTKKVTELMTETLGIPPHSIGIICPFRAQVQLLRSLLSSPALEVNTIDQFQGRDKLVVLLALVRGSASVAAKEAATAAPREGDILADARRLNVAVSRARVKCVVIGNWRVLDRYEPFARLKQAVDPADFIAI